MIQNLLFVYPEFPNTTYFSFGSALPFIGKKSSNPPLGLITVAAMVPKKHNIKMIDMNVEPLKDSHLRWADVVLTSSMIIQQASLEKVIERAKSFNLPVVAGGPFPTQYYDLDLFRKVDHIIIGEAESGVLETFLKDFENGAAKKVYARSVIRNRAGRATAAKIDESNLEKIINFFGEDADIKLVESRPDMSLSPIPRFDLLDIKKYGSMAVQFSRGCPFSCDFCTEPALFGDVSRVKSAERFVKELETIYNLGYKRGAVFVVDDNFIGNIKHAKEVLIEIKKFQEERKYPFDLYTEASINLASDKQLMGMMRDAGFNMVFVGIESVEEEVLKKMNKSQNLRDLEEAVKTIQSYGMEVTAGFIYGSDGSTLDEGKKIFEFCQNTGIPTAMVGLLTAARGSEKYEQLKKEGRLREDTCGDNTHNFRFNFDLVNRKDEKLIIENYKNTLAELYDRSGKNYFARCKKYMDNVGYHPKPARKVRYTELRAFSRSLKRQLFTSHGWEYFKFLAHSAVYHTKKFPEAVRLGICGYHFFDITDCSLKADDVLENLNFYRDRLIAEYKRRVADKGRFFESILKETDSFFYCIKQKISSLPSEYRPKLVEAYNNLIETYHSLNNQPLFCTQERQKSF